LASTSRWGIFKYLDKGRELAVFLLGHMAATMVGNYPFWLRSTIDPSYGLAMANDASVRYGSQIALV
jgi:hypothetical protein